MRYRPEGDLRAILALCAVSLVVHPAITWADTRAGVVAASLDAGITEAERKAWWGAPMGVAAARISVAGAFVRQSARRGHPVAQHAWRAAVRPCWLTFLLPAQML